MIIAAESFINKSVKLVDHNFDSCQFAQPPTLKMVRCGECSSHQPAEKQDLEGFCLCKNKLKNTAHDSKSIYYSMSFARFCANFSAATSSSAPYEI
jgi:hypothetical protein